jgi:hypothetical protein
MNRKARDRAVLCAIADQHLAYEIEMFFGAVRYREVNLRDAELALSVFVNNAKVEVFVTLVAILVAV